MRGKPEEMTLEELARQIGADLVGPWETVISGVCSVDDTRAGCVTCAERPVDAGRMRGDEPPAAVICGPGVRVEGIPALHSQNPKMAFAMALALFYPESRAEPGVHPSAFVSPDARIRDGASVGPLCVVGQGSVIGENTVLRASVTVGAGVVIGVSCVLHPGVCVYDDSRIGNGVILHSGVIIGGDGFGYVRAPDGRHIKMPQVGNVVIGDDVEIGANSAVDRATIGSTVIGAGTKIDNLVQVGHNVRIGRNVVLCGQVGISGSCTIGDNTVLAGQAGVSDHVNIGSDCIIGGKAGVLKDVPDKSFYSGFPAGPHRENMRTLSALKRMPELMEMLKREREKEK